MAKETKQYDDLVRFLTMVRDKIKDPKVDTEIAIAYAMTDKLGELEAFITSARPTPPPLTAATRLSVGRCAHLRAHHTVSAGTACRCNAAGSPCSRCCAVSCIPNTATPVEDDLVLHGSLGSAVGDGILAYLQHPVGGVAS